MAGLRPGNNRMFYRISLVVLCVVLFDRGVYSRFHSGITLTNLINYYF
jgi:hypothetical protein